MVIELLVGSGVSAVAGFFLAKKLDNAKYEVLVAEAKAKAKVIEHEAEILLKNAKNEIAQKELELKKHYDSELSKVERDFEKKELILQQKEKELNESFHFETKHIDAFFSFLAPANISMQKTYEKLMNEGLKAFENSFQQMLNSLK